MSVVVNINAPSRPLIRYHGGKWKLAPWIIKHFPEHRVYVEPFGGGGSVLMIKARSHAEVYNDLDSELVNLFRVARDQGAALCEALHLTPFSREEFDLSFLPSSDSLEQARRTVVRAYQGFGSSLTRRTKEGRVERTGFRCNSNRSGTTPAQDWRNYPDALEAIVARLQGVVIEHREALEVMQQHDAPSTLHYVDPPYVAETRDAGSDYRYEMTGADHCQLAEALRSLRGAVVLSGYPCALYDDLFADWVRVEKRAYADGARERVEVLWLNPACADRIPFRQEALFA